MELAVGLIVLLWLAVVALMVELLTLPVEVSRVALLTVRRVMVVFTMALGVALVLRLAVLALMEIGRAHV